MDELVIDVDDPHAPDVTALLQRHLDFARSCTPPEAVFALDLDGLTRPEITFCSARRAGLLLGVGALRDLGGGNGEVKSMHTAAEARGHGVGAAVLEHLLGLARRRRWTRVSLETGSQAEFAAARALYARAGFVECGPFADYPDAPTSTFMTRTL